MCVYACAGVMNFDLGHVAIFMRGRVNFIMAENSEFCQQAVTTANLLLEAASLLETSQTTEVGSAQYQRPHPRQSGRLLLSNVSGDSSSSAGPSYYVSAVGTSGSSQHASVTRELHSLFN